MVETGKRQTIRKKKSAVFRRIRSLVYRDIFASWSLSEPHQGFCNRYESLAWIVARNVQKKENDQQLGTKYPVVV
jgi:hypothetical protein